MEDEADLIKTISANIPSNVAIEEGIISREAPKGGGIKNKPNEELTRDDLENALRAAITEGITVTEYLNRIIAFRREEKFVE